MLGVAWGGAGLSVRGGNHSTDNDQLCQLARLLMSSRRGNRREQRLNSQLWHFNTLTSSNWQFWSCCQLPVACRLVAVACCLLPWLGERFQNCSRPSILSLGTGCARLPALMSACLPACVCHSRVCDILLPKGSSSSSTLRIRNVPAFTAKGVRVASHRIAYTQRVRVFRLIAGSNGISQHVKWSVYVSFPLVSVCLCACVCVAWSECACCVLIMPIVGASKLAQEPIWASAWASSCQFSSWSLMADINYAQN